MKNHRYSTILLPAIAPWVLSLMLLASCGNRPLSDAYGQFEATEHTVSAEMGGKLLAFSINEGDTPEARETVGVTDTLQLHLKVEELQTQLQALRAKISSLEAEKSVIREELEVAQTDFRRLESLHREGAATQKQLDDARGRVNILQKRISALDVQKQSVEADRATLRVRIRQVRQQIEDSYIINPVRGTVLAVYAEPGELVGQGAPLYEIAKLDTLELRAYVSGAQLPAIRLNQQVEVLADKNAGENQSFAGWISWIASEAEFTPKMIQTKEERVSQVYAIKVKVPNRDGILKIGMPGEVNF